MPNFLFADAIYAIPTNFIIWAICIGANLGFLYNYFSRNIVGELIRRLLSSAVGEDNAKTLCELGYKKFTLFYKVLLKNGSSLRRIVSVIGGSIPASTNATGIDTLDWENARFYISEANKTKASTSYGTKQNWIFLPIFAVASVLLSLAMTYIMPFIIDNLPLL